MQAYLILLTILIFSLSLSCQNAATTAKSETEAEIKNDLPMPTPTSTPTPTPIAVPKIAAKNGLIELTKLDDTIKLDIRYATTNNFVGKVIYKEARAFLQSPAAEALIRIHRNLKKQNLGLVIFDGYRPLSATKFFWEVTPASKKKFVANPKNGSRHNRGCAVDLSLFDLKTGENIDMPTDFDNFTEKANINYAGATELQKKNREILRNAMEADGFKIYPIEWWHYDFQSCPENRILDLQFSDIK